MKYSTTYEVQFLIRGSLKNTLVFELSQLLLEKKSQNSCLTHLSPDKPRIKYI